MLKILRKNGECRVPVMLFNKLFQVCSFPSSFKVMSFTWQSGSLVNSGDCDIVTHYAFLSVFLHNSKNVKKDLKHANGGASSCWATASWIPSDTQGTRQVHLIASSWKSINQLQKTTQLIACVSALAGLCFFLHISEWQTTASEFQCKISLFQTDEISHRWHRWQTLIHVNQWQQQPWWTLRHLMSS